MGGPDRQLLGLGQSFAQSFEVWSSEFIVVVLLLIIRISLFIVILFFFCGGSGGWGA